jgi:hypothetical protein
LKDWEESDKNLIEKLDLKVYLAKRKGIFISPRLLREKYGSRFFSARASPRSANIVKFSTDEKMSITDSLDKKYVKNTFRTKFHRSDKHMNF